MQSGCFLCVSVMATARTTFFSSDDVVVLKKYFSKLEHERWSAPGTHLLVVYTVDFSLATIAKLTNFFSTRDIESTVGKVKLPSSTMSL
ncbi:hypothetical protein A2U01_0065356, partial [Trifolium medium]|nr:hypothetical protein [Trifolium medium]